MALHIDLWHRFLEWIMPEPKIEKVKRKWNKEMAAAGKRLKARAERDEILEALSKERKSRLQREAKTGGLYLYPHEYPRYRPPCPGQHPADRQQGRQPCNTQLWPLNPPIFYPALETESDSGSDHTIRPKSPAPTANTAPAELPILGRNRSSTFDDRLIVSTDDDLGDGETLDPGSTPDPAEGIAMYHERRAKWFDLESEAVVRRVRSWSPKRERWDSVVD